MLEILAASFVVMLAALSAVVTVWHRLGSFIERNMGYLVSFTAGVFIVVSFQLAVEAVEHAEVLQWGVAWIGAGALLWWGFFKFLPTFHAHSDSVEELQNTQQINVKRVITADAVHNVGDGILLTSAFLVDPILGVVTTASIFVHELVQETSEFFVLRRAGFSVTNALAVNFAVSGSILVGAVGSFFLFEAFTAFETPLLGIAAGAFLVVVFLDLIPHSRGTSKGASDHISHIVWFAAGLTLMVVVNSLVSHSHDHGHDYDNEHIHHDEGGHIHDSKEGYGDHHHEEDHHREEEHDELHHEDHDHDEEYDNHDEEGYIGE